MEKRRFTPSHQAFTLIELLVVIAILGILAAILFPVFGRARENGRRASCQSNLKQIGLGLLQYSQDYDEILIADWYGTSDPTRPFVLGDGQYKWMDAAYTYIKSEQVFRCPSATNLRAIPWVYYKNLPAVPAEVTNYGSYVIVHGYGPTNATPRPCQECSPPVSHPAVKDLISMAAVGSATTTAWVMDGDNDENGFSADVVSEKLVHLTDRHLETVNVLFLDGHVKALKRGALSRENAKGIISAVTIEDD